MIEFGIWVILNLNCVYKLLIFSFFISYLLIYGMKMIMIDKCFGGNCPLKHSCKRYTDPKVSSVQNILYPPYFINTEFSCDRYWGDPTNIIIFNLEMYFNNQEKINTNNAY
jgi:hypothetical protein